MALSESQIERYSRQIVLPEVGGRGQERLLSSSVTVAGDGEIMRWALQYLVAAGIGRIDWYSADAIEPATALCTDLADLNPDARIRVRLWPSAVAVLADAGATADVLISTPVSRAQLEQVNLAALRARIPLLIGMIFPRGGRVGRFAGYHTDQPCACCAPLDSAELTTQDSALTGPASAVIGSLLALEVIKLRLDLEVMPAGRWLQYQTDDSTIALHIVSKRPDCPACAEKGAADA